MVQYAREEQRIVALRKSRATPTLVPLIALRHSWRTRSSNLQEGTLPTAFNSVQKKVGVGSCRIFLRVAALLRIRLPLPLILAAAPAISNHIAGHDHLNASIQLPPRRRAVIRDRIRLPHAPRHHVIHRYS